MTKSWYPPNTSCNSLLSLGTGLVECQWEPQLSYFKPWFYPYEDLAKSEIMEVQILNHAFMLISCYSLEPDIKILWYFIIFSLTSGDWTPKKHFIFEFKNFNWPFGRKFWPHKKRLLMSSCKLKITRARMTAKGSLFWSVIKLDVCTINWMTWLSSM